MNIYPAIDLRNGGCVRLVEGDYDRETRYATDPVSLARNYEAAGATMIHVVDLDGAKQGEFTNLGLIRTMARSVSVPLQCGGGIRSQDDLEALFSAGVARVVIGSLAVEKPNLVKQWLAAFGAGRLTLALDCRCSDGDYLLATSGWTRDHSLTLEQCLDAYAGSGLRHVLCTDISRDGTLKGPNVDLYRRITNRFPDLKIQASGGVSDLGDFRKLLTTRADAVIVGKALLDNRFTLEEGLSCLHAE